MRACSRPSSRAWRWCARTAADAATGSYGALRSVVRQLGELNADAQVGAPHSDALAVLAVGGFTAELDALRRPELQSAFQAQLDAVARVQPVMIAIDDAERCDEPSLAALTVAAALASDRVLIAMSCLTAEHDHRRGPLRILMREATRIALPPLSRADTEALLASVFGEVPYLEDARRSHSRARRR